jgi:predicted dehydrogenase
MLGQGFMGRAHSNAFHQVGHFFDSPYKIVLKVICGRDRSTLQHTAAQWGWEEIETNWQAVVERKDVDVVDIALPNALHAPAALAAAQAGKIVLCEKPLAMSVDEAEQMAKSVRNVPNLVWFNYRRVPAITFAKRLIGEGRVGQVFHYRALYLQQWGYNPAAHDAWRFKAAHAGTGAIGDLLAHAIDLAFYLNGRITDLAAASQTFARGREVDDAVMLLAHFQNGSIGTFEASRFAIGCSNRNAFEINGSKGMLRFNLEDMNRLEFYDSSDPANARGARNMLITGPQHPYSDNFWPPGHIIGYEHTFIATLADFLRCLASEEPFHPNFEDGLRVQRALEAVVQSSKNRDWIALTSDA